jgi:hypothetical protein
MSSSENKLVKNILPEKKLDSKGFIDNSMNEKDKNFCEQTIKECGEQMTSMSEIIEVYANENAEMKKKLEMINIYEEKIKNLEDSDKLKTRIGLILAVIILIAYYRSQ